MARKVIRLTEAKIAEMVVEVAKRVLNEGDAWNRALKGMERGHDQLGNDGVLKWDSFIDAKANGKLQQYKEYLDYIARTDEDEVSTPDYQAAVAALRKCSMGCRLDDDDYIQAFKVLRSYMRGYSQKMGFPTK